MDQSIFQVIPQELKKELDSCIQKIWNKCLQNIYQNIDFKFLFPSRFQDENSFKIFLFDYLSKFNFITYESSNINSETNISDFILCVENHCIIIKSINSNIINSILTNFECKVNAGKLEENEDIDNFCCHFYTIKTKNELIKAIFRAISCYLIRRYSYPTHFFKDPSFFIYKNEKFNFFENNIKQKMTKILYSNQKEEINNLYTELFDEITQTKFEELEKHPIYEFKEDDFFILKTIPKNKTTFYLVIDLDTLHPFMMSNCNNREIEFCEKYNHPCFTRFYGFIKDENGFSTKIIYEYMSNDNLSEFITKSSRKNIIDESYIFMCIYRIFKGIEFLRSNSLVHRDLKPTNILIDHDFIPYIADFEFIRPIDDGNHSTQINGSIFYASPEIQNFSTISYSSDIYSFGLIIYFLYEKKDMIDNKNFLDDLFNTEFKNIKKMENGPENIKRIYYSSVVYNQEERITNDEIKEILTNEMNSFYYLDKYFMKQYKQKLYSIIIQFIYEKFIILNSTELKEFMNHIYEFMLLKLVLNIEPKNESALINIGDIYYYKKNYLKALKYYELASQLNNSDAFLYLADLYYNGYGVLKNFTKAIEYYKKSADLNNAKSLFNLGNMYLKGIGVTKDNSKAIEYYELAAKLNNINALNVLGNLYLKGEEECKIDYARAKECFEKLAKQNNSDAYINLGYLYEFGLGVQFDYSKAKEYYQIAADQNNPKALNELGIIYFKEKNFELAKKYFELSAKCGYILAFNNLGYMYMNEQNYSESFKYLKITALINDPISNLNLGIHYFYGFGVKKDDSKAKKYFEIASLGNIPESFLNLGIMYFNGYGVKQCYSISFQYFEKAAKLNNSKALLNLGNMYYFGQGVQQDYIKAKNMYELSAKLNDPQALFNLGHLYLNGLGVKKDSTKVFDYFDSSARLGNLIALLNIGNLYFYGIGVEKNYSKAVEIYEKVSKLNNSDALFNLGICYYYGKGVPLNYSKAVEYFKSSSDLNHSWALLYLGFCYYKGNGVKKNFEKSNEYFRLSADQNNEWALFYIGKCYLNGDRVEKDCKLAMKYLKLSANQNNSYAQLNLGNLYFFGISVEKDLKKAIKYYEMSAIQINLKACLTLAYFYLYGYGVEQNFSEVKKILNLLEKTKDSDALLLSGIYYLRAEKNYTKAIKYFEESGKYNNSSALFNLGCIYLFGQGVRKDYSAALFYYKKSAELNNSFAFLQIGNLYFNGEGVEKDFVKARNYYEKAAKLNNSNAILNLGIIYYLGLGIEKDQLKAKNLFEQATLFNNSSAYYYLGFYYLQNEKNYLNAIQCFELSAEKYNPFSLFILGYFYSNDNLFEYDIDKSIYYLTKCLEIQNEITMDFFNFQNGCLVSSFRYNQYHYRSSNDLGLIYLIDKNDTNKAFDFIKQAAFAEFPYSQNNLGLFYEFILNDVEKAEYFYNRSSKNNFSLAFFNLAKLKEKNGKINEEIELYEKASKYEDEPLKFHNFNHYDKRLVISKTFIICCVNLKLSLFYLIQSNFIESKKYFIKAFAKLKIDNKNEEYKFRFKFNDRNSADLFTYLRNFIFDFPLFNLKNQPNLNLILNDSNKNNDDDFSGTKNESDDLYKSLSNLKNNKNDYESTKLKINEDLVKIKKKKKKSKKTNDKNSDNDDDDSSSSDEVANDDDQIFDDPKKIFEFIISNNKLLKIFINEIKSIIHQMEQILSEPPHTILFGRMNIVKSKQNEQKNPLIKDINQTFYDGFCSEI